MPKRTRAQRAAVNFIAHRPSPSAAPLVIPIGAGYANPIKLAAAFVSGATS
jgi:hypothetical protein